MKVLVIGSGGREHALCWKLQQSEKVREVFAAPGSDGMASDKVTIVDIPQTDHESLIHFAKEAKIDMTIVGPEEPLVNGIVDAFQKEGLAIFGPSKKAAMLEGSKQFAKELMKKYQIPTAAFATFSELEKAKQYVLEQGAPIVIKADGLAAGKGVVVAETVEEAIDALETIMAERTFGDAGNVVVIEECLRGEELSLMAFVHEEVVLPMVPVQDHKRAFDGDLGPNTGGMGAYSPVPHIEQKWIDEAIVNILHPMAKAMVEEGVPFTGILYAGLMITETGPKVIEFNARFGDPETQVVLPRLETDLIDVIFGVLDKKKLQLSWSEDACVGVVLASNGYPGNYEKGVVIDLPEDLEVGQKWFHAGLKKEGYKWATNGGRVVLLSSLDKNLASAMSKTYGYLNNHQWEGLFYRKDIGRRAVKESSQK